MKRSSCYPIVWITTTTTTTGRRKRTLLHSSRCIMSSNTTTPFKGTIAIAEKYRLPLRRALHFIEEGTLRQESFAECEEDINISTHSSKVHTLRRDAARYAAYHCHHLLNAFRAERQGWTKQHNELSFNDLTRVMEFIFFASLLLHLTALYETADKYCEALINLVFSCSVFLSKDVNKLYETNTVYSQNQNSRKSTSEESLSSSTSTSFSTSYDDDVVVKKEYAQKDEPWDSLHWAIIHFTHGVSKWGLLDHTESLFDMRQTTIPCCAILRTFAKLIRFTLISENMLSREEIRFLSYIATKEGSSRWLATSHYTVSSQLSEQKSNKERFSENSICFAQQRRLQLLPLLWMALLARRSVVFNKSDQLHPSRYALLRALLLFSKEAKGDVMISLLVKCFYFHAVTVRVSAVEMGVLLAQMERHNVFSSSLPISSISLSSISISSLSISLSSSSSSCVELLRLWMKMEETTMKEAAPVVKSPKSAYIAFRNIPLSAIQIVGDVYTSTSDGEAFVHELLLRALLQWSFRLSDKTTFRGELEELLLSAQHMILIMECIKLRESSVHRNKREGASSLVIAAVLRAFAVRVAVICRGNDELSETSYHTLLEFDKILQYILRKDENGLDTGSVPYVYEKNRHGWLKNV